MLEWLQSAWSRWKVQVSFVGGALVLATTYGTCTYEAPAQSDEEAEEVSSTSTTDAENSETTVPVSSETSTEESTIEVGTNDANTAEEE